MVTFKRKQKASNTENPQPGANEERPTDVIVRMIESLSPGLSGTSPALCREVQQYLKARILKYSGKVEMKAIHRQLQISNQEGLDIDEESLMIVLDGLEAIIEANQLISLDEVGIYIECKKAQFWNLVDEGFTQDQADLNFRPRENGR